MVSQVYKQLVKKFSFLQITGRAKQIHGNQKTVIDTVHIQETKKRQIDARGIIRMLRR